MIQFCQQDLQVHTEMYENRETDENSVRDRRCDRLSVYVHFGYTGEGKTDYSFKSEDLPVFVP